MLVVTRSENLAHVANLLLCKGEKIALHIVLVIKKIMLCTMSIGYVIINQLGYKAIILCSFFLERKSFPVASAVFV